MTRATIQKSRLYKPVISHSFLKYLKCHKYRNRNRKTEQKLEIHSAATYNAENVDHYNRKRKVFHPVPPLLSLTSTSLYPFPHLSIPINLSLPPSLMHSFMSSPISSSLSLPPSLPHPDVSWPFCRPSTFLGVTWSPPPPISPQGGPFLSFKQQARAEWSWRWEGRWRKEQEGGERMERK